MNIGIVTDSSCDLPAATLLRHGVAAVPLRVTLDDRTFRDGRDLDPEAMYAWMEERRAVPHVAPPEPDDFTEVYERLLRVYDRVVSIHVSGALSDTAARAQDAARNLPDGERIVVIDSGTAGAALGEIVLSAATTVLSPFGLKPADITLHGFEGSRGGVERNALAAVLHTVHSLRERITTLACPVDTHWLEASGRLERRPTSALRWLRQRPLLVLRDGSLEHAGSAGSNGGLPAALERLEREYGDDPVRLAVGIASGDAAVSQRAKELLAGSGLHVQHGRVQRIGAALGSILGPNAITVSVHRELGALLVLD